jgi:cellulose synthase/poly-beta-1,6-N-acetylglucosamine synthase-like glycosyltransferase
MSLGIDPVVSNVLFTLSLVPHLCRIEKAEGRRASSLPADGLPRVSVIVALYREGAEDISATLTSLAGQSYPKHLCEVLVVVEPDDEITARNLKSWPQMLLQTGISNRMVYSDGKVRSKPHALNIALECARGEYCVFYDGADRIDSDQIASGISVMMKEDSDVAQARVLREGPSLLSRFLLFDTVLWYWKYLPLLLKHSGGFPLSGEGLFIRRQALADVGGFPEVLTEDALLGLTFLERGKRFSLVDSNVVERAPSRAKGHFKQKMRWHRGYLTCLRKLLFSLRLPLRRKLILLLPFSVPICAALGFVGWTLILGTLLTWTIWRFEAIDFSPSASVVYTRSVYCWALFLALFGIPFSILSCARTVMAAKGKLYFPLPLLLPAYWMFVGLCALCSFFRGTKDWGKTDRGQLPGSSTEEAVASEPPKAEEISPACGPLQRVPQSCPDEATVSPGTPGPHRATAESS